MLKNHSLHIPVMGTAFTIDTPLKVGRFGISSVVSLCDDELCEEMREHYAKRYNLTYTPIKKWDEDFRARRITAYLNDLDVILTRQVDEMKGQDFTPDTDLTKYFEMLSENTPLKNAYNEMLATQDNQKKLAMQAQLKDSVKAGCIDVNIMTKLDRDTKTKEGEPLPKEFSDTCAALRGYANSTLNSRMVFSAGFNRRLYAYCQTFNDFLPDENGEIKKGIVLKVSDFRSCQIQGKFLAKKGIWISEYRIESGLNCGGHAFATDGLLLGPILQEIQDNKAELFKELHALCNDTLKDMGRPQFQLEPKATVTVQGGIGTAEENNLLLNHYKLEGTGWASPFLLVPEVTTLDDPTRDLLAKANASDFYLSGISPLGVPFNTVRGTDSENQKLERAESGKPGSPCPKGFLVSNTEFSKAPVCTASVFYQKRKLKELEEKSVSETDYKTQYDAIIDKTCLCEDLAASALIYANRENKRPLKPVVCPGPNLANFNTMRTLKEMVGHVYGKLNCMTAPNRSHMFISECKMYIAYLEKEIKKSLPEPTAKQLKYITTFKDNILSGLQYYKELIPQIKEGGALFQEELKELSTQLETVLEPVAQPLPA